MLEKVIITILILSGINGFLALVLVIAERFLASYGECQIIINQEKSLKVNGGMTLLSALNGQKIFLPSACGGRGTCGYCKCKVTEGGGPLLPTELPLLIESEIDQQIRLSCQLKVKRDIKIEIPEALFNIKEFEAEVILLESLTYDIKLLRLKLIQPEEIRFKPGQYVQLQSEPYDGVKERVSRAYSIASSSLQTDRIDLIIRLVPEGICTTWVHQFLKKGDRVKFTGPMGDFYLHEGEGEIIMVAGGSGMAPMVSLLYQIDHEKIRRKIHYFFGSMTKKDLFYMDEMEQFQKIIPQFKFIPTLSDPKPEDLWQGEKGLITLPLEAYLKTIDTKDAQAYLCGSPGMIQACIKIFKSYGITQDRIYYDPFA
jgi:Na+-transporting NADH:ubiquinone oxidoreductase subunit F